MPYNGSGTFNRVYSWAADALAGLFISSSRMDTEMNGMATGLTNCVTRDGQSPPSANIPMATFKLTGLGNGSAVTDSAAFGQIAAGQTGWFTETAVAAFVNATSFTVAGNVTATYTPGRRIKCAVTGPPTAWYGTILSSVFGALTTVTVLKDTYPVASAALDAGFASLQYGVQAADYLSIPRKTTLGLSNSNSVVPVSNTNTQWTNSPVIGASDLLSEWTQGTNTFTAKTAGVYAFSGLGSYICATTYSGQTTLNGGYKLNGGAFVTTGQVVTASNGGGVLPLVYQFNLTLAAADTVSFWFFPGVFSVAGPVSCTLNSLNINRLT